MATTNWTLDDVQRVMKLAEQLRAELRATVKPQGDALVEACRVAVEAERAYAADPDRDDVQAQAKVARTTLDTARSEFDKAVSAAKATRTKALDAAMKQ